MTRIVIGGRPVGLPVHAATGPHLGNPVLSKTAAEINPAPPDPGACPTCGQPRANLLNTFATGSRGGVPVPAREVDDPAEVTDFESGLPIHADSNGARR